MGFVCAEHRGSIRESAGSCRLLHADGIAPGDPRAIPPAVTPMDPTMEWDYFGTVSTFPGAPASVIPGQTKLF